MAKDRLAPTLMTVRIAMPMSTLEAAVTDGSVVDCTCDHILTEIGLPTPPRTKLAIKSSWAECTNDSMKSSVNNG